MLPFSNFSVFMMSGTLLEHMNHCRNRIKVGLHWRVSLNPSEMGLFLPSTGSGKLKEMQPQHGEVWSQHTVDHIVSDRCHSKG